MLIYMLPAVPAAAQAADGPTGQTEPSSAERSAASTLQGAIGSLAGLNATSPQLVTDPAIAPTPIARDPKQAWTDWTSVKEYDKPGARGTAAFSAASEIEKFLTEKASAYYVDSVVKSDGIHVTLHKGFEGTLPQSSVPVIVHYSDGPLRADLQKQNAALQAAIKAHADEFVSLGGGSYFADYATGAERVITPGDLGKVQTFLERIAPDIKVDVVSGGKITPKDGPSGGSRTADVAPWNGASKLDVWTTQTNSFVPCTSWFNLRTASGTPYSATAAHCSDAHYGSVTDTVMHNGVQHGVMTQAEFFNASLLHPNGEGTSSDLDTETFQRQVANFGTNTQTSKIFANSPLGGTERRVVGQAPNPTPRGNAGLCNSNYVFGETCGYSVALTDFSGTYGLFGHTVTVTNASCANTGTGGMPQGSSGSPWYLAGQDNNTGERTAAAVGMMSFDQLQLDGTYLSCWIPDDAILSAMQSPYWVGGPLYLNDSPDTPNQPTTPLVSAPDPEGGINLHWTAQGDNGRAIDSYSIDYTKDNGVTWNNLVNVPGNSHNTWCNKDICNRTQDFKFRVKARNANGWGPYSIASLSDLLSWPTDTFDCPNTDFQLGGCAIEGVEFLTDYQNYWNSGNWFHDVNQHMQTTYGSSTTAVSLVSTPTKTYPQSPTAPDGDMQIQSTYLQNGPSDSGLVCRQTLGNAGFMASPRRTNDGIGDGTWKLWWFNEPVASTGVPVASGQVIKLTCAGNFITLEINGLVRAQVIDSRVSGVSSPYAGYKVGTGSQDNNLDGIWDDFSARAVPANAAVPGAPTVTSAFRTGTSILLSWLGVAGNGNYTMPTDYKIEYKKTTANTWTTWAHTASPNQSATITGLATNAAYQFRVSGINSKGTGTASAAVNEKLPSIADTFNRADTATGIGTTTTGAKVWSGTGIPSRFKITSNQLQAIYGGNDAAATVNPGTANYTVQATNKVTGAADAGLVGRYTDDNNYWLVFGGTATGTKYSLAKKVGGGFNWVSTTNVTPTAGDVVQLIFNGNTITLKVNGVTLASTTDTFNNTATLTGFRTGNGSTGGTSLWDDFYVF
jgi:hypothetical protein